MFVVWFKKDGEWHWVEIFMQETSEVVRAALKAQGYEVTETSHDPRKYSLINQHEGN
jgi:hypothetical protein